MMIDRIDVRFTDWLNSLSPGIKFTAKHSDKQLEVLDTLLCIINGRIESKLYSKPTDVFTASIITLQIYLFAYFVWRCPQDKKNL